MTFFLAATPTYVAATSIDIAATMAGHPALWWLVAASAILGLGFGTWVGITIHRSFAARRNAGLGYRIERVDHFYRFNKDDPRIQTRRRTEHITAKRDGVNLILGRFRPSMREFPQLRSPTNGVNVGLIQTATHPSDWNYYVAHWRTALERGTPKVVAVELLVNDTDWSAASRYSTLIHEYIGMLTVEIEIPAELVEDCNFHCYATRIIDGNESGEQHLEYSYDKTEGKFRLEVTRPRRNWTYVVTWDWVNYSQHGRPQTFAGQV